MSVDRMTIRTGVRGLRTQTTIPLGFLLFFAGSLGLTRFPQHAKEQWPFLVIVWSFILAGVYLLVWRRWIVLDRGQGAVEEQSGPLFPLFSRVLKLTPESCVYLSGKGITDSDPSGEGSTVYSIGLIDLKWSVFLYQVERNRRKAVKIAEEIAGFLNLNLVDSSSDENVIQRPGCQSS